MRGKNYKPDIITLEQKINSTITADDISEVLYYRLINGETNMFDDLNRVIRGNTPYISLNQIKQNLEENKERTELDECWLTPFYITPQRTYEFYYLKLIMNRNMPFDEFKKSDNSLKSSLPESIVSQKRKCYINIDDSKSKSELAEELLNYLFYIETNEEIIDTVTRLFGSFDSNNIYFEYIE